MKRAILYGGTGQAVVTREILELNGISVVLVVDDTPGLAAPFDDVPLVLGMAGLREWLSSVANDFTGAATKANANALSLGFCATIGNPHGRARVRIADHLVAMGLEELSAIHPSAVVSKSARCGRGLQVMAGAIIQPGVVLGRQCIVNTRASIDHQCVAGDGCGFAPGSTLCGNITCGDNVWICAGATVLPRLHIGDDAIVGAGAVVTQHVTAAHTVAGVPAREMPRA